MTGHLHPLEPLALALESGRSCWKFSVPQTWETRWAPGKAYYQTARYDEALKLSQDALAGCNGKAPEIALLEAQAMTAAGRYEDAAGALRDFLRGHGDDREAATGRRWLEQLAASGRIRTQ